MGGKEIAADCSVTVWHSLLTPGQWSAVDTEGRGVKGKGERIE